MTYTTFPESNLWRSKLDGSERLQLTFPRVNAHEPRWSPDGKQILFTDVPRRMFIVPADGGSLQQVMPKGELPTTEVGAGSWMPDGSLISSGRHPGVVLLQGRGSETRWGTNRFIADRFARSGIAALTYDKRGSGSSTGDWKSSTYDDLANDALAAIDSLLRDPTSIQNELDCTDIVKVGSSLPLLQLMRPGRSHLLLPRIRQPALYAIKMFIA